MVKGRPVLSILLLLVVVGFVRSCQRRQPQKFLPRYKLEKEIQGPNYHVVHAYCDHEQLKELEDVETCEQMNLIHRKPRKKMRLLSSLVHKGH